MIRTLRAARRSAGKARAQAANQLRAMLITAPEGLKSELRGLSTAKLVTKVSRFRPGTNLADVGKRPHQVVGAALGGAPLPAAFGRKLRTQRATVDRLVAEAAPELLTVEGVSTDTAASVLIAAGDDPKRLKNEAAFAHLWCGAAPIPASSGKTIPATASTAPRRPRRQPSPLRDRYLPHEPR